MSHVRQRVFGAGLLVAAAGWVYLPAIGGDWQWDDALEITDNLSLRSLAGLGRIWTGAVGVDYFPLKSTFQWTMWHLWHASTLGYHLANLGVHMLAALLLWRVLAQLGIRLAWLGAMIFALHPLAVESVAWISELKNVLSLLLLLAAFSAFLDVERPNALKVTGGGGEAWAADASGLGRRRSTLAVLLFVAALLCKTSVVMFPCVLLLYAWWRRGRVGWRDVRMAAPFFAASLVLGLVTVWFQGHRAMSRASATAPMIATDRLASAVRAVWFYIEKCVWPHALSANYPQWRFASATPLILLAAAASLGIAAWLAVSAPRGGWQRHFLFGVGCFVVNLVPVLGFVPMAYLKIAPVADHFAYISLACFAGLTAAMLGSISLPRLIGMGAAAIGLTVLAVQSHGYAALYRTPEALWTWTLSRDPASWVGHNNYGLILLESGRYAESERELAEALDVNPDFFEAQSNIGYVIFLRGRPEEALPHYQAALRIFPSAAKVHNAFGRALLDLGRYSEAAYHCAEAMRLKPDLPDARANFANALCRLNRLDEAIAQYRTALTETPGSATIHGNLGYALAAAGRLDLARSEYDEAVRLRPDYAVAQNNLGIALARLGKLEEAKAEFRQAIHTQEVAHSSPDSPEKPGADAVPEVVAVQGEALLVKAHFNLGLALGGTGHVDEAVAEIKSALKIDPGYQPALETLATIRKN